MLMEVIGIFYVYLFVVFLLWIIW